MATINLGRVKPVFRGAYSGATSYVVDDIVTYSNETYICILASTGNLPTDTTYWTKLAAKGVDGTDLTTTLTTQGDLLYRDGSGLARLGAGTAGQALITNGAGANPSWGAITSPIAQFKVASSNTSVTNNSTSTYVAGVPNINVTPTNANNPIFVEFITQVEKLGSSGLDSGFQIEIYRDSTILYDSSSVHAYSYVSNGGSFYDYDIIYTAVYDTTHNTTSQINYNYKFRNPHNTQTVKVNSNANENSWVKVTEINT